MSGNVKLCLFFIFFGVGILYFIKSEIGCHCYSLNFGFVVADYESNCRLCNVEMQNMLQKWFEEANSRFSDQNPKSQDSEDFENTDVKIPYQLWNIGKYGTCAEAAITGIMPPPLMEQQQVNYSLK